jgi:hypothetical protein
MAKPFDAGRLFEPWKFEHDPRLHIYRDDEANLDAVQSRKKGLALFASAKSEIAEWLALASERDLFVTLQPKRVRGSKDQPINVFLSRPEEMWRIPALTALWKTAFADGRWSDGAENQMSYLLGYTGKQREAWLAAQRQMRPAWTCATVYALLTAGARQMVESVGRRCFGPPESVAGMTVFHQHGDVLKKHALALVPRDHTLARVGLQWDAYRRIFGKFDDNKRGVITRTISSKLAPVLSAALQSNVQFLGRAGWA